MNEKSLFELVKSEFPNVSDDILKNFTQEGYQIFGNHCYKDVSIPLNKLMEIMGVEEKVSRLLFVDKTINLDLVFSYDSDFSDNFGLIEVSVSGTTVVFAKGVNNKIYNGLEKLEMAKDIIKSLNERYEKFKDEIDKVDSNIFDFIFFHCDPTDN